MSEGKLYRATGAGQRYTIGGPNGSVLALGQAIDVLLGGFWISGHTRSAVKPEENKNGMLDEASEESFPASDAPAWSSSSLTASQQEKSTVDNLLFIADADGNICGLHEGMYIRTRS